VLLNVLADFVANFVKRRRFPLQLAINSQYFAIG